MAYPDVSVRECPTGSLYDDTTEQPTPKTFEKKELIWRCYYAAAKEWSLSHGRQLDPLPLKESIERRIKEWFTLVDDDGGGTLDPSELAYALKASGIPASAQAIVEMIKLFDFDRDGEIAWREFHHYLCYEVMAGKDPLGAEYVLPSGLSLPIGSMISAIRRRKMMDGIEKGGTSRDHWLMQGPHMLRHLLEEQRYDFSDPTARGVLDRILNFKPSATRRAGPEAEAAQAELKAQKRRIERFQALKAERSSRSCIPSLSGGPVPSTSRANAEGAADASTAAAAGGAAAAAAAAVLERVGSARLGRIMSSARVRTFAGSAVPIDGSASQLSVSSAAGAAAMRAAACGIPAGQASGANWGFLTTDGGGPAGVHDTDSDDEAHGADEGPELSAHSRPVLELLSQSAAAAAREEEVQHMELLLDAYHCRGVASPRQPQYPGAGGGNGNHTDQLQSPRRVAVAVVAPPVSYRGSHGYSPTAGWPPPSPASASGRGPAGAAGAATAPCLASPSFTARSSRMASTATQPGCESPGLPWQQQAVQEPEQYPNDQEPAWATSSSRDGSCPRPGNAPAAHSSGQAADASTYHVEAPTAARSKRPSGVPALALHTLSTSMPMPIPIPGHSPTAVGRYSARLLQSARESAHKATATHSAGAVSPMPEASSPRSFMQRSAHGGVASHAHAFPRSRASWTAASTGGAYGRGGVAAGADAIRSGTQLVVAPGGICPDSPGAAPSSRRSFDECGVRAAARPRTSPGWPNRSAWGVVVGSSPTAASGEAYASAHPPHPSRRSFDDHARVTQPHLTAYAWNEPGAAEHTRAGSPRVTTIELGIPGSRPETPAKFAAGARHAKPAPPPLLRMPSAGGYGASLQAAAAAAAAWATSQHQAHAQARSVAVTAAGAGEASPRQFSGPEVVPTEPPADGTAQLLRPLTATRAPAVQRSSPSCALPTGCTGNGGGGGGDGAASPRDPGTLYRSCLAASARHGQRGGTVPVPAQIPPCAAVGSAAGVGSGSTAIGTGGGGGCGQWAGRGAAAASSLVAAPPRAVLVQVAGRPAELHVAPRAAVAATNTITGQARRPA